jgi:hypothetical protein
MKLSTSLIAVKKITCNTPRSIFPDDEIEQAANLILAVEGLINPIVVRRTGLQSYEVINGDFEYYAAARAREINLKLAEMVSVYIVEDENAQVLFEQIKLFRRNSIFNKPDNSEINLDAVLEMFSNLESRFEKITHQFTEDTKDKYRLEFEIKELKNKINEKREPIDVFNNCDEVQLTKKLINAGISEKQASQKAQEVISVRKTLKDKQFKSLTEIVEKVKTNSGKRKIKAISEKKMLEIVQSWSDIL